MIEPVLLLKRFLLRYCFHTVLLLIILINAMKNLLHMTIMYERDHRGSQVMVEKRVEERFMVWLKGNTSLGSFTHSTYSLDLGLSYYWFDFCRTILIIYQKCYRLCTGFNKYIQQERKIMECFFEFQTLGPKNRMVFHFG